MTADEVAEVEGHYAVCEELRKHMHGDRRPLSKVSPTCVLYDSRLSYLNEIWTHIINIL